MTNTLLAKQIHDALSRARKVGLIEEAVTIAGCPLVLQNLPPEEYPAIVQALEETPEEEYLFQYQLQHVARALVEIDGVDLRGVEYIEDEVPAGAHVVVVQLPNAAAAKKIQQKLREDLKLKATVIPPEEGEVRTVKIPRHEWVLQNVARTWGYEAVTVAWRKFSELRLQADEAAKNGIKFQIPDETPEEKVRRLLGEVQEAAGEMPDDLLDKVLSEIGLLRKSSQEELETVNQHLQKMADEGVTGEVEPVEAPVPAPTRRRSIAEVAAAAEDEEEPTTPAPRPSAKAVDPQALMRNRQPLNQQMADPPVPTPAAQPVPAQRRVPVPEHIRQAALENTVGINSSMVENAPAAPMLRGRAAEYAAIEGLEDPSIFGSDVAVAPAPVPRQLRPDVTELARPPAVDGKALKAIVDSPPVGGINPRFKRP